MTGKVQNSRSNYTFALDNRLPSRLALVLWVVVAPSNAAVALGDASVPEAGKDGPSRTRQVRALNFEAPVGCHLTVVAGPVRFVKVQLCWMGD
jgi:hypothetical protein